jgi:hypothetical protein
MTPIAIEEAIDGKVVDWMEKPTSNTDVNRSHRRQRTERSE